MCRHRVCFSIHLYHIIREFLLTEKQNKKKYWRRICEVEKVASCSIKIYCYTFIIKKKKRKIGNNYFFEYKNSIRMNFVLRNRRGVVHLYT